MRINPRVLASSTIAIGLSLFVQAVDLHANPLNRKALVIGNDNYTVGRLRNAGNDAIAMSLALTDLKYQVALSLNGNRAALVNAVDVFVQNLSQGDFVVVYYSGHGLQADGENYLIPTDFALGNDDPYVLGQHAYSLANILQKIQEKGVATTVIILDACRDNPFISSRSAKRGWSKISGQINGTYLAFATAPGSTASDNPADVHGLFTKSLLRYISQPLDLDNLFESVRREVIEASHGTQVPWTSSSLLTSVFFDPKLDIRKALQRSASGSMPSMGIPIDHTNSANFAGATTRSLNSEESTEDSEETSARLLISSALTLARQSKVNEAVRILDSAINAAPWSSVPLRLLGLLFHLLGRRSEAIGELDRALEIDPADYRALYYRCLTLASEDPTAAIGSCQSSVGINPNFASAHLGLSNAWLAAGNVDEAYGEASRSVALLPQSALAFSLRGRCELQMGRNEDAQRDFEKARILQARSDRQTLVTQ